MVCSLLYPMVLFPGRYSKGNPPKINFKKSNSFARKIFCPVVFTSAVKQREIERERERERDLRSDQIARKSVRL